MPFELSGACVIPWSKKLRQHSRSQNLAPDLHRSAQFYLTLIEHGLDGSENKKE